MKTALAFVMGLCLAASGGAQELSTAEFPAEDEVFEALASGEIDYEQYIQLLEVLQDGVDSTELHLLDLVPNLSFFRDTVRSSLETEQGKPFLTSRSRSRHGSARYGYYQRLEEPGSSRYSLAMKTNLSPQWGFSLKVRKDLSGRERFTGRTLKYGNDTGYVREVQLGTFTKRLGLGTVFGYRGKLFQCDDHISGESFAYPDFGGFNGAMARLMFGHWEVIPLTSVHRDPKYRLFTGGGMLSTQIGNWTPGLLVAYNRLTRRGSEAYLADYKAGLSLSKAGRRNNLAVEYCVQTGFRDDFGTFVLEGTQKLGEATVHVAAWRYGDQYLNLSGGAKAASLQQTEHIGELDFSFSEKRTGQVGSLLKSAVSLRTNVKWSNSLLLATRNEDTTTVQWLSDMTYLPAPKWRLAFSFLEKRNERVSVRVGERRVRAEIAYRADNLSMRSHIAHTYKNQTLDYFSWLAEIRWDVSKDTRLQIWSNLSRFARNAVDYWYLFLRTEHQLFDQLSVATKLMHRYDEDAADPHQVAISLELEAAL